MGQHCIVISLLASVLLCGCPLYEPFPRFDLGSDVRADAENDLTANCDAYCDLMATNCAEVYSSEATCLEYCNNVAAWELGDVGDRSGNTIACRITLASQTNGSASACVQAGPTGGDTCGTWCDNYCYLAEKNCKGSDELYVDFPTCAQTCEDFDDEGLPSDSEFDTVQCRIYHLGVPAYENAQLACPDGRLDSEACAGTRQTFVFRSDPVTSYRQVDRVGLPLVSTALIESKQIYNRDTPTEDGAQKFRSEIESGLTFFHYGPAGVNANGLGIGEGLDDDLQGMGLTPCLVVAAQGESCGAQTVPGPNVELSEFLIPDRLLIYDVDGLAGFPNGRRLADPVAEMTLAMLLLDLDDHTLRQFVGTMSPGENDLGFNGGFPSSFPFLHPPHQE